jgi:capsule biosynthesis phosphatase
MKELVNTIYIDLDGTLCPIKTADEKYEDLLPKVDVVNRLAQARDQGYKIIIYTSRNMRTFAGEIASINVETLPQIIEWLKHHKVPFDGLIVGKPWPGPDGFYVDDRTLRPDEFVKLDEAGIRALFSGQK